MSVSTFNRMASVPNDMIQGEVQGQTSSNFQSMLSIALEQDHNETVRMWNKAEGHVFKYGGPINYWTIVGVKTLHMVRDVDEGERLLSWVGGYERLNYITCRDRQGRTALHIAADGDQVEMANLIISSVESQDRDFIITKVDDKCMSPLHLTGSSAMVRTLLDGLSPHQKQNFIKLRDGVGVSATHYAASNGCIDMVRETLKHSDELTRIDLLLGKEDTSCSRSGCYGGSLLMWAALSGDRNAVKDVLKFVEECDLCKEALYTKSPYGDGTPLHYFVVFQWIDVIRELLMHLQLDHRKELLNRENSLGFSPHQLARVPPKEIGLTGCPTRLIFELGNIPQVGLSIELLNLLHFFTNQYHIVEIHLNANQVLCHRMVDTMTSESTVRIFKYISSSSTDAGADSDYFISCWSVNRQRNYSCHCCSITITKRSALDAALGQL